MLSHAQNKDIMHQTYHRFVINSQELSQEEANKKEEDDRQS